MQRILTGAGITDPRLADSYRRCRRINSAHGKTYYLATLLLPARKRPFVHALYGFARVVDDIIDDTDPTRSAADRAAALQQVRQRLTADFARGASSHPVLAAVLDTATRWEIPLATFEAFLDSMAADLTVSRYQTFRDLQDYTYGSAGVIGAQMLPILEPSAPEASRYAETLGEAFQLANFIRDVGEDLDRGRIYLPLTELARFGVTPDTLATRVVTDDLRAALDFQIRRVHRLAAAAGPGIELLHPSSRDCIRTAATLYIEITDAVVAADYQVFSTRARVPARRRARVAAAGWHRAVLARRRFGPGRLPAAAAPAPPAG